MWHAASAVQGGEVDKTAGMIIHFAKACAKRALTGHTVHLAAQVQIDCHRDDAVPRQGLNLHSGCRPVGHA
eukprot:9544815-Karenia_brevis.AAC.1